MRSQRQTRDSRKTTQPNAADSHSACDRNAREHQMHVALGATNTLTNYNKSDEEREANHCCNCDADRGALHNSSTHSGGTKTNSSSVRHVPMRSCHPTRKKTMSRRPEESKREGSKTHTEALELMHV